MATVFEPLRLPPCVTMTEPTQPTQVVFCVTDARNVTEKSICRSETLPALPPYPRHRQGSSWTPHPRTYDNTLHRGLAIVHGAHKALAIKAAKSRPARFVLRMKGRFLTTLAAEKGSRGGLQGAGAWQPSRTRTRYLDTLDRPSPRPPNRYLDTPSRVPRLYLVPQIPQSSGFPHGVCSRPCPRISI